MAIRKPFLSRKPKRRNDKKQNLSGRARVAAKQQGGQIHDLDNDIENVVSAGDKTLLTPVEQALENWKARQADIPWWWMSFAYPVPNKPRQYKHAGVCIVQGWKFLDALNQCNKLKITPLNAACQGEELSDLWVPREGEREKWTNRLLSAAESKQVFGEVVKVTEAGLYQAGKDEVKFK